MVYLGNLIAAAKREDWVAVDCFIPNISEKFEYVIWAYGEGRIDPDGNVRDLAASIIEIARVPEERFSRMRDGLAAQMKNDKNYFVGYRLAFALAKHGPGVYKEEVIEKLHEAEKDENKNVRKTAKRYLKILINPKNK